MLAFEEQNLTKAQDTRQWKHSELRSYLTYYFHKATLAWHYNDKESLQTILVLLSINRMHIKAWNSKTQELPITQEPLSSNESRCWISLSALTWKGLSCQWLSSTGKVVQSQDLDSWFSSSNTTKNLSTLSRRGWFCILDVVCVDLWFLRMLISQGQYTFF